MDQAKRRKGAKGKNVYYYITKKKALQLRMKKKNRGRYLL
uniref:Uncharacterized protein n=1 Tax=Rhizophora mucronata TaxID=61149 RepID=A0A2P2QGA0_RHIMU